MLGMEAVVYIRTHFGQRPMLLRTKRKRLFVCLSNVQEMRKKTLLCTDGPMAQCLQHLFSLDAQSAPPLGLMALH